MKKDIVLAGVGGQGILTIAAMIGRAAMQAGLNVKQSEVHGMSQRGGAVLAHLRLSSEPIASDLIGLGTADLVVSVEPMEALRQAVSLSKEGVIITNVTPVRNIGDYPETEEILAALRSNPRNVVLDADAMAEQEAGSRRSMNMVILGAVSQYLDLEPKSLEEAISFYFAKKGEQIVANNLKAFEAGRRFAAR